MEDKSIARILLLASFIILLSGCSIKTHVITEYDGDREVRWYTNE